MTNPIIPFKSQFLSQFILAAELLPFTSSEIVKFDRELNQYEQLFLDSEIERHLISKNELLASFAISKAENSTLTLEEAKDVYQLIINNKKFDFINHKLKSRRKLTQKDYEKLEFFNIANVFRKVNNTWFTLDNLTADIIQQLHLQLTQGLDIFKDYLPDFTVYRSGQWRNNNEIRVGDYAPALYTEIPAGVAELIDWLKSNRSVISVAVFHTALYALHPFNNGNKRVCRILEHVLLRDLGLNKKNLYSTSYYYHKQKPRYYKYLLNSLERKNLNQFTTFMLEAVVLSISAVVKTSLEIKRNEFIQRHATSEQTKLILKPLVKKNKIQFKNLFKSAKKKMARQTFVTYLQQAEKDQLVIKHKQGRATYYTLKATMSEAQTLEQWLNMAKQRLTYIPDELLLA